MTDRSVGAPIVLVVDPNQTYLEQVSECLRPRYRVVRASSMAEAAQMIVMHQPSIMLIEIDLPDGDGRALVHKLRQEPATRGMIVACLTARSATRDKIAGFQAGADDYIVKPVNPSTFMWRIVLLMRLRQL